ncbi:unnamed protein product [Prorocentrum cordatum]|uniref:Uncharacterized protein n=1 Tax=Prorocentrum cordatum TaxID=2364126 RepID=A0ABN9TL44_9DINO|nr:unnamed protein product [Polarella glacialis]
MSTDLHRQQPLAVLLIGARAPRQARAPSHNAFSRRLCCGTLGQRQSRSDASLAWDVGSSTSEEEKVPFPRFPLFGPPGRPSSPPLDSLRSSGQNAPWERSGEWRYRYLLVSPVLLGK